MTEKQIVEMLKSRIKYGTNQAKLAKELGVSRAFLSDVLAGKRSIGAKIPKKLGFILDYRKRSD